MASKSVTVRHHVLNVGQAIGVWTGWFWSTNWNAVGAFLSCVATFLVILNMCGLLQPLKDWAAARWKALTARKEPGAAGA